MIDMPRCPQGALDDQQVVGGAVKQGRKGVPKAVRCQVLVDAGLLRPVVEGVGDPPLVKARVAIGQKKRLFMGCAKAPSLVQEAAQHYAQVGLYELDLDHIHCPWPGS